MQDEHLPDEQLQQYADGDLSGSQAEAAAHHMESCSRCAGAHQHLLTFHQMMVVSAEHRAASVDFDALFQRIERGTQEAGAPSLGERLVAWWRELLEQRPARLWIPAGAALAVVAALALLQRTPEPPVPTMVATPSAPGVATPGVPQPEAPTAAVPQALTSAGSEVVGVDFGGNSGSVMEIALADGTTTPVVWLNDDEP